MSSQVCPGRARAELLFSEGQGLGGRTSQGLESVIFIGMQT